MATLCIAIENDHVLTRFHRAMNRAGSMSDDMIRVNTLIQENMVIKVVHTECPWVIAVFQSLAAEEV